MIRTMTVREKETLLEAMRREGTPPAAPCGGNRSCGKCRVRLTGGNLPEPCAEERQLLTAEELVQGWRLACAVEGPGCWTIEIPQQDAGGRVMTEDGAGATAADPLSRVICIKVEPPTLNDQRSDAERAAQGKRFLLEALRKLPEALRQGKNELFLAEFEGEITDCSAAPLRNLGIAVDVGTTTMAAYLVDLDSGRQLACASEMNPQRAYGGDVISRADHAAKEGGRRALQSLAAQAINRMGMSMLREASAEQGDVRHIVCVGNTIMMHLLAGLETAHIARAPFTPVYSEGWTAEASELGMDFPAARVLLGPCVAGYVGADTVAAALACGMDQQEGLSLLVDIGTNGEIALGGRDGLLCCSAAAGPAFEGAHIRCGSGAQDGAVDHVHLRQGTVEYSVLGGGEAKSICGSGLVDAVAELMRAGVMDETGRIDEDETPEEWQDYLFEAEGGPAFSLDGRKEEGVYVCQQDLREVQLAKAAIAAGIEVLLNEADAAWEQIGTLYLAGGFGNYIDQASAVAIGLLPPRLSDRVRPVGNAAGGGARQMLMNRAYSQRAEALRRKMRYVELSARADFQEKFVEKMFFGEDE